MKMAHEGSAKMSEPAEMLEPYPIANPGPLGLSAFGITTLVLSLYNIGTIVNVNSPQSVIIGLALFYGGLAQLLAGMWEFKVGNNFGATAFISYAAFWASFAVILIPGFGVVESYVQSDDGSPHTLEDALGVFLLGWAIFTFIMFLCTFRQNVALMLLFGMLTITFGLLAISNFNQKKKQAFTKAGGYAGILTAIIALYTALAGLATHEITIFTLPVGHFARPEIMMRHKDQSGNFRSPDNTMFYKDNGGWLSAQSSH